MLATAPYLAFWNLSSLHAVSRIGVSLFPRSLSIYRMIQFSGCSLNPRLASVANYANNSSISFIEMLNSLLGGIDVFLPYSLFVGLLREESKDLSVHIIFPIMFTYGRFVKGFFC